MNLTQGSIVLVPFPFSDQKSSKVRPSLVVSSKDLNGKGKDIWVTGISSQTTEAHFNIDLKRTDLSFGRLKKDSYIKCNAILSIEKGLILRKVAQVKPKKIGEVLTRMSKFLKQD